MKRNNPAYNYPPGICDSDIDRAWGESRYEFQSEEEAYRHYDAWIEDRIERELLKKLEKIPEST
jgi:hypothetical protein